LAGNGLWWERPDLRYVDGELQFGGRRLAALAAEGTPAYVYRAGRVRENLGRLRAALDRAGVPHDAYFALKANRFGPLLDALRAEGRCGIDACSPAEVELALAHRFPSPATPYRTRTSRSCAPTRACTSIATPSARFGAWACGARDVRSGSA
jgi:diaminopimelate decarboxylase